MTLQRRIFVGHLLFLAILLGVVAYAFVRLRAAYDESGRNGSTMALGYGDVELLFDRLQEITNLNQADPQDPSFAAAVAQRLADSRNSYIRLERHRATLAAQTGGEKPPSLPTLEAIYGDIPKSELEGPDEAGRGPALVNEGEGEKLRLDLATKYRAHLPTEGQVAEAGHELRTLSRWLRREGERQSAVAAADTRRMGFIVALVVATSLGLAAVSSVLAIRRSVRPIHSLMEATESIAAGSLGVRLAVSGNDEFANLTKAFNNMSDELVRARKRESDFLAVATHELKTPLACIKADAGMIRKVSSGSTDMAGGREVATYLGRIDDEIASLTKRVEKLLELGVIEAGQLRLRERDFMVEGFLSMAAGAMRPVAAERKIRYDIDISDQIPPMIHGDPDKLRQVLANVLDNAFKYTPEGGSVRFAATAGAGDLVVEVSDTGPGIPPEQLGAIFEKYTRVRHEGGTEQSGTGLGLAVARGIVKAHRGSIEAQSEQGRGSRFLIRIPANVRASEPEVNRKEQPA